MAAAAGTVRLRALQQRFISGCIIFKSGLNSLLHSSRITCRHRVQREIKSLTGAILGFRNKNGCEIRKRGQAVRHHAALLKEGFLALSLLHRQARERIKGDSLRAKPPGRCIRAP